MAEKKQGVLKKIVKDFGFIQIDGENREIFVHQSDYKVQMIEGSRVRFEESAPDPAKKGKTHAMNVEILPPIDHAVPTPAPVATPVASTPTPAPVPLRPKRFEVTVCQLTPDRRNPIRIITKNAKGKPTKGEVQIITGQRFKVDGYTQTFECDMTVDTHKNGYLDLLVQLLDCDTLATFIHTQSGEMTQKSLLKEE